MRPLLKDHISTALGSAVNQHGIFNAHVVDHINLILRLHQFSGCTDLEVAKLKHSGALLITSLLENNDVQTTQMAKQVVRVSSFSNHA